MTKITIGARGSKLSLAYVAKVKDLLLREHKNLKEKDITIQTIKTSGDINQDIKLSEIGGKNLFCKEIEEKLLKDEIDIAVHSLKDMESIENNNLLIGAFIKRNDFRDVIVSKKIKNLEELNNQLKIGSSSRRRELQLKKISKKITVKNIRGNIDTIGFLKLSCFCSIRTAIKISHVQSIITRLSYSKLGGGSTRIGNLTCRHQNSSLIPLVLIKLTI